MIVVMFAMVLAAVLSLRSKFPRKRSAKAFQETIQSNCSSKERETDLSAQHENELSAQRKAKEAQRKAKEKEAQRKAELSRQELLFKQRQAENDINSYYKQREDLLEYGEYLELERDACAYGSSNYHKWNKKVMANDNRLSALDRKIEKAIHAKDMAILKLSE